ncbi:hypothetical protein EJ03DRAFT_332962 [Teratosphaeria nubilosa]|uniref:Uncharacterized protein n=1 Tax=Teratosphaeria nubilosa TaxID=161662 RepID=A0A6G1LLL9_9PEZI|nr:hypothetical protein EJ03DRAFT_332962 [Teratosphaeria nubilosa]
MADVPAQDNVAIAGDAVDNGKSAVAADPAQELEGGRKRKASDDISRDDDDDDDDEQPAKQKKASAKKARQSSQDKDGSASPDPAGQPANWNFSPPPKPADQEAAEQYRDLIEKLIKRIWEEEAGDRPTFRSKPKAMPFEELYPDPVYCEAIHYLETAMSKLDHIAIIAGHSAWKREREERSERKVAEDAGSENKAKTFRFNALTDQYRADEPEAFFDPKASESAEEPNEAGSQDVHEAHDEDHAVQPITTQSVPSPLELAQSDLPKPTQETFPPDSVREMVAEANIPTETQAEDDVAASSNASVFDEEQGQPPDSAEIREAQVNELLAQINAPFLEETATRPPADQVDRPSTEEGVREPFQDSRAHDFPAVPAGPLLPATGGSLPGLFAQAPRSTVSAPSQPMVVEQDVAKPAGEQGDAISEPPVSAADQPLLSMPEPLSGNDKPESDKEEGDAAPTQATQRLALPPASAAIDTWTTAAAASTASSCIPPYHRPSERTEDETDCDDSPVQGVFKQDSASAAAPELDFPDEEEEGEEGNGGEVHDEELFGAEDGDDGNPYEDEEEEKGHEECKEQEKHEQDEEPKENDEADEREEVADHPDADVPDGGDVKLADHGDDENA